MKNYVVKSLISFDDYEGLEVKPENPKIKRNINDIFNCTKERYEYLKENKAVELVGINKIEEPVEKEEKVVKEAKQKKSKRKK